MENPQQVEGKTPEQVIEQINNDLGVHMWPGAEGNAADLEELADAEPRPSWWHGDEDASATFLREMGVVL